MNPITRSISLVSSRKLWLVFVCKESLQVTFGPWQLLLLWLCNKRRETNLCFSSQIQSSLWYKACSPPPVPRDVIQTDPQTGTGCTAVRTHYWVQQVVGPSCQKSTTYRKTCTSHTWVSQQASWCFHFSWRSFTKCTAMACSPVPSQEFKSTQVHYLHKS